MSKIILKKIILWLKMHHWIPVYRKDILEYAKDIDKKGFRGLCGLIEFVLIRFDIVAEFPLFNEDNALLFDADIKHLYWWKRGDWSGGRMEFLNWLIEQYEDDKEDLRKYKAE